MLRFRVLRFVAVTVAGLLLLFFLVDFVGLEEVYQVVSNMDHRIFVLAPASAMVSSHVYIYAWYVLLRGLGLPLGFKEAWKVMWCNIFVDQVLPSGSIGGEATRIMLLSKVTPDSVGEGLATIVVHRICSTVPFLAACLVGLVYFTFYLGVGPLAMLLVLILYLPIFIVALILAALVLYPGEAETIVDFLFKFLLASGFLRETLNAWRGRMLRIVRSYSEGLRLMSKHMPSVILSLFLSFTSFIFEILTVKLVFTSIGICLLVVSVIFIYSVGMMLQSAPTMIPGVPEVGVTYILSNIGLDPPEAAWSAILNRLSTFWVRLIVGGLTFTFLLADIYGNKKI
ncbi:flippase-like domain-containing protein [Candidatus Bathyarchaeota archaeon]|nr:flippase-like domain-containing protein [Candidatus Bathyarchaeota archaeon]